MFEYMTMYVNFMYLAWIVFSSFGEEMKICWLKNFQRKVNKNLKITMLCLISIFTFCKVIYISRIKIVRTYLILLRRESEWELRENSQCQHSNLQNKINVYWHKLYSLNISIFKHQALYCNCYKNYTYNKKRPQTNQYCYT